MDTQNCSLLLSVNSDKTDAIVFRTKHQLANMNKASVIKVGDSNVTLSKKVKILGVHLDPTLSMDVQVNSIVSSCNFHIHALRHIRNHLTLESVKAVACGLVLSRI